MEYPHFLRKKPAVKISAIFDEQFKNDLFYYHDYIDFYHFILINNKRSIVNAIDALEAEIDELKN